MNASVEALQVTQCRQCCGFCDRLIEPAGCIALGCRYLYQYEDEHTGRRYMGCLEKVFEAEIDVELFEAAQRTRAGFGGIKAARQPLSDCAFLVDRAYPGEGEAFRCVNPRFFDRSDVGPDGYRAVDLRDVLQRS